MQVGIFSDTVKGASPEDVAERTRSLGVDVVQLRLDWPSLNLIESAADRQRVRRAYERAEVGVAALAAYTNLLDPQPERRAANRAFMERLIDIAPELGTNLLVTETGTYNATDSWSADSYNQTPEAWAELLEVTTALAHRCERSGVVLVYEPYVNNVVDSACAAARLVDEVASAALAFVFDAAGLTRAETVTDNRAITRDCLSVLRGHIALAHADDVRYADGKPQWLPLGWGDLDAELILNGLVSSGFDGALIVEHLAESLVPEALAFARRHLNAAPV